MGSIRYSPEQVLRDCIFPSLDNAPPDWSSSLYAVAESGPGQRTWQAISGNLEDKGPDTLLSTSRTNLEKSTGLGRILEKDLRERNKPIAFHL